MSTPLPATFWQWARWRLGHAEYKAYGPRYMPKRPPVPWAIPPRWWRAYLYYWPPKPKPPPPPPKPQPISTAFWQRPSCWSNHPDGAHPDVVVPLMRHGGQRLISVQVLDGTQTPWTADTSQADWESLLRQHIPKLKAAGMGVAGWGWGKAQDVNAEAEAAWNRCQSFGLEGYEMNGEKPYEGGGKSGAFVRRFRQLAGRDFPLAWSPEPQLDLDHGVLQAEGVAYKPQAYPGENRWDIEGVVTIGLRFGYKLLDIIPLVSTHDGTPPESHRASAQRAGVKWLDLYPTNASLNRPGIWPVLGSV